MTDSDILTRVEGRIGVLTFNRPNVLNAFSSRLIAETNKAIRGLIEDEKVLAIVVHGSGRAFSAGFELKEAATRGKLSVEGWRHLIEADFDFIMQFWDCPKPTIAAVHGYCLAGTFELALACDVTIAGVSTRFGEPEVRFGSGIVAMLLPWFASPKHAKEIRMTGHDQLNAQRMLDCHRLLPWPRCWYRRRRSPCVTPSAR
jgi:enoyl-CoA hydratase